MKILIVDDYPWMRQMIRTVVADLAEAVCACADGSEVVAMYAAQQFSSGDRVLMDLQMAGVDGLEATRRLRAAATQVGARGYVLKEDLLELRQVLQLTA